WFKDAFVYLNVDLGGEYRLLVTRWVELARSHGWKNSRQRLPTSGRPDELKKWIQSGRYRTKQTAPKINPTSLPAFVEQVWQWWILMQPTWRHLAKGGRPVPLDELVNVGSLQSLDISGPNGWLSILACAKWWGLILRNHVADKEGVKTNDWLRAVADFSNTLKHILHQRNVVATPEV
ncbi:hypothetical protein K435DRAFT_666642, partial [Dendrothele bispora CBS 962.96]